MIQDLRFAWRMLRRSPVSSGVVVLSLALGIGANSAIFSVINALLLRPLPYRAPEQLVKVFAAQPDPTKGSLPSVWAYPRFEVLRERSESFAAVAGFAQTPSNLTGTDTPERLQVEIVSAAYFPLLGVDASVGRTFAAEEDRVPGANLVVLLAHALWQRRFGGDAQVIGRTIQLDGNAFTVVGVLPPGVRGQNGTADAWVTMSSAPVFRYRGTLANAKNSWFQVVARLKDGVTLPAAQAEMKQVVEEIERRYPGPSETLPGNAKIPALVPLQSAKVDPAITAAFLILLAAVGLVLLIACANTANLLLARGLQRRRELGVRTALGAGRLRLMRQLVSEGLVLAVLGGSLGILIAGFGLEWMKAFRPSDDASFWTSYTRTFDFFPIELDWRVLTFNFALALLTGALFASLPALRFSRADAQADLKQGAGTSVLRDALVVGELALSLMLLIGAGLMIRSLGRLQGVELGFTPEHVLLANVPSRRATPELYEQLLARVRALPGVEAAGIGSTAPLLGTASRTVMDIEGRADVREVGVGLHSVSPEYFTTLRIGLVKGRLFTERDRAGAPRVAIINRAAAQRLFPGQEPLGQRIRPHIDPTYATSEDHLEIVGVVENARYDRLEDNVEADVYLSSLQPTDATPTLVVRSSLDPTSLAQMLRREVLALDRNVPLAGVRTMQARVAEVTSRSRFLAVLLALFGGLALLLSSIGVYGVMAYAVSARMRELGIRVALGARGGDIARLVLRDGAARIAAGLALGLPAAWASLGVLRSQIFDTSTTDPPTFLRVSVLVAGAALLACLLPVRRAMRVDAQAILRHE